LKVFDRKGFWVRDEMYKMRDPYSREKLRVLLSFDMSKLPENAPSREDRDNAIAWIQQVGQGNARAMAVDGELNEREALGSNVWVF
jgi:hypothetical protein